MTLAKSYQPYGETLSSAGNGSSPFAFTGEQTDVSGLTYLRARYYSSGDGRFLTRDTWMGEYNRPLSLNRWGYVEGNPINYTDPSGLIPIPCPPPYQAYNTCTWQDWYSYYGRALLQMIGIQVPDYHITIGESSYNPTGYAFQQSLDVIDSTNKVIVPIADTGLSMMPGGNLAYDSMNSITGANALTGYQYTPGERTTIMIFTLLGGYGDCFQGLRFAPDIGGGNGGYLPRYSPAMQKGLDILKTYAPEFYAKVKNGEVLLEEIPMNVSGGTRLPDRIVLSADPNFPGSTAATLYEEIYHFTRGHDKLDYFYELDAKSATASWILRNNISELNPLTSFDILAFKRGGLKELAEWIMMEYNIGPP